MHQISLGGRATPGPLGELTALPQTPSWIKGPTSKGRGGGWKEGEKKGGKREGRGRKGTGRGKGGEGPMSLSPLK